MSPVPLPAHRTRDGTLLVGTQRLPVLVIVEGVHDIEFLQIVSAILHAADQRILDLRAAELAGRLLFIPAGGADQATWSDRFAPLGCREFHLFDRDEEPITSRRRQLARAINARPGCRAVVMRKRALENYLHPAAVHDALDVHIEVDDDGDVAEQVATARWQQADKPIPWLALPLRSRKRLRNKTKRALNTAAARQMSAERLSERDPAGELRSWLTTIHFLVTAR